MADETTEAQETPEQYWKRMEDAQTHGDHNILIGDKAEVISTVMMKMFTDDEEQGVVVGAGNFPEISETPDGKGSVLGMIYGNSPFKMLALMTIRSPEKAMTFSSLYPYIDGGHQYEVTLEAVKPWKEFPYEAWLLLGLFGADGNPLTNVCVYDVNYYLNRDKYKADELIRVVLNGIASRMTVEDPSQTFIVHNPAMIEETNKQRKELGMELFNAEDGMPVEMGTVSILYEANNGAPDEYYYRSEIFEVDEHEIAGFKMYRVGLKPIKEVMDFYLDVYVSPTYLEGYVPKVGDVVQGTLWLQGYLVE